jgi:hypothetical protein
MVTLSLIDDFAQHFDFIYANTDELKRQCYLIRFEALDHPCHPDAASRAGLDIDQYDAHSLHVLLRHRASGKYAATIRVIENQDRLKQRLLPCERAALDPLFVDKRPLHELARSSFSEISRLAIRHEFSLQPQFGKLTLGLYLSAIAMARLEFHHYTFARLDSDLFKSLRAQGLNFEHANRLSPEPRGDAIYYLNVEAGIAPSSASYHLSQHILNKFAHQLHMPLVLESDEGAVQSA